MFTRYSISTITFLFLCGFLSSAQKKIQYTSPDGKIIFTCRNTGKKILYNVSFNEKTLVSSSELQLIFRDVTFADNIRIGKPGYREASEKYELVVGKVKNVNDHYREVTIPLQEISSSRKINLVVRIFNDGLAFRYEIPKQAGWESFELLDEKTSFHLEGNPTAHTLFLRNFTTSHEGKYTTIAYDDIKPDTLMDMPTLFEYPGNVFMAITEASLVDYAGMYLVKHSGALQSILSPLPKQTDTKVKATLPHNSPWRVMLIGDRIGALIESNIITDLNEPCKIKDISWIKPGKTTFPWWNGNVLPDTINAPGNNFVTQKYYIDFCARNGLEYHSVVEYGLHQWYMDDGVSFMPGPHSDPTTPVPGLDMKEVCDYAKSKGVDVRVWVHWWALYPKLDSAFANFEKWGLKGMMIDFMDRDDQEMVNMQNEMLEKAAAHHLHVQFHGAYKNTGLSRTWPNEFTREGTLNYEANKWSWEVDPDHDINFPFTRMLAGSTDYHLGGFRAVPDSLYIVQYTRPLMRGTRCHMLAMYVVLENYLGMVCDYPAAYEGQPGFEFLKEVPTVWDETKVLDAKVGEYILIARRKNDDWFVGAITNHNTRRLTIDMNFIGDGNHTVDIYTDAADAKQYPNHLDKQSRPATGSAKIEVSLASGGGMVMHVKK